MQIISVLNQKGGSGKTTLATHLARALQRDGSDVLLADADRQGSARDWAAARADQPLAVAGLDRPSLLRDVARLAGPRDFVVVDGAPATDDLTVAAIKAADFVLIPVQPSPLDLWATADLVDWVQQRIEMTDGRLKAAFVVSRAVRGTKLSAEVDAALAGYGLPVLSARIHQRIAYPTAISAGMTVMDIEPDGDAANEIGTLAAEIKAQLTL